jgi:hypothetical protein
MLWPGWVGDAADQALAGRWFHGHSLLQEPVEEFAPAARFAPVESKGDFVHVGIQMLQADSALAGSLLLRP